MAHAQCILDNQGYKHTLRICNTFCFTIATMVARRHLNIALQYTACLVGRDSAVGIATLYGLDAPLIESRLGRDYPQQS